MLRVDSRDFEDEVVGLRVKCFKHGEYYAVIYDQAILDKCPRCKEEK